MRGMSMQRIRQSPCLEFAEEYALEHGLTNVSFGRADFNDLVVDENGFDAGICRWGLMFAADLVASLRSIRSLLRPGGTFAAIVWGPSERAKFIRWPILYSWIRLESRQFRRVGNSILHFVTEGNWKGTSCLLGSRTWKVRWSALSMSSRPRKIMRVIGRNVRR